jgi:hypothetical protein
MNKYHNLSDKTLSGCHAPLPLLPPLLDEIGLGATEVALKARKLKFWLPAHQIQIPTKKGKILKFG